MSPLRETASVGNRGADGDEGTYDHEEDGYNVNSQNHRRSHVPYTDGSVALARGGKNTT